MIQLPYQLPTLQRYAIGLAVTMAIVILQWGFWWLTGTHISYLFYIATLAVAAVLLGPGPSLPIAIVGVISGGLMFDAAVAARVAPNPYVPLVFGVLSLFFLVLGYRVRVASERSRTESELLNTLKLQAEKLALVHEQRFRVALDASAVPFVILEPVRDHDHNIVDFSWSYANGAAERAIGQHGSSLVGKRVSKVLLNVWDTPGLFDAYVSVSQGGETQRFEQHFKEARNSIETWFDVIASPLGESAAVWFADVTAQKTMEKVLREADYSKDAFIATLAHELRNPLAPIRQAAALVNSATATAEQQRWAAEVIDRQSQHMAHLLDDLLDLSRITRGALVLKKSLVSLDNILKAAIEAASPVIESKQHHLSVRQPPHTVYAEVDEFRLTQILTNLLTNAAKYTEPNGQIMLVVENTADELTILVSDNGIGLLPDQLNEIFKMFTQVKSDRERAEGLGIGLAVTKGLVELHGGSIEAKSAGPDLGSQFTVRLPLNTRRLALPSAADISDDDTATLKQRVLVADDNHDAADVLAVLMQMEGHEVLVAYDGQAALNAYNSFDPDIALLDIGMPGLSGTEVARRIRASQNGKRVTLVALTGWGQDKDKTEALAAGFNHHLTKPVDFDAVKDIVQTAAAENQ